ncbi:uncharacterized protein LOC129218711 [Uloborus diversus]|uniref:uncharacterized protein LOC129218711 n=1 Tax=Uloborus diversus TaxID=327109 RepID=UPI002409F478|nr:uncharacterized protein LOC129218711 [Uloborus diversus]
MKLILTVSFFVFVLSMNHITEAIQVVTMDTYKTDITLESTLWDSSSSLILKSHSTYSYRTGMSKRLNINAPIGSGLVVTIRLLDFRPNCIDNLTLYDNNNRNQVMYCNHGRTPQSDYDKNERKTFYVSTGRLGVIFNTDRFGSTILYRGFQLTVTVVNRYPCRSYEYYCRNQRCIADGIRCDGYNHCGDGSSEINCYNSRRTGRTVGIAIGSIFLVIGIIMALVYGMRRCKSQTEIETVVTTHQPPTYPVNPPPAYTTSINSQAYPPPGYTTYPQGHANPTYR